MVIQWSQTPAAIWRSHRGCLRPITAIDSITLESLVGIDRQKKELIRNTERFLNHAPFNNALLWGARGTGKSSLIKALLNHYLNRNLRLIEIFKNDLIYLPEIIDDIRNEPFHFIIYCDDFTFEDNENNYTALKTLLEGSIEAPPSNVVLYATSNRRHLMPEYVQDNIGTHIVNGELHYSDTIEEKISLSDRFGLWLSFYPPTQDEYLAIVDSYFPDYPGDRQQLHLMAKQFAQQRASRSGRTAKQFFNSIVEKPN